MVTANRGQTTPKKQSNRYASLIYAGTEENLSCQVERNA